MGEDNKQTPIYVTVDPGYIAVALVALWIVGMWWWQLSVAVLIIGVLAVLVYNAIGGSVGVELDWDN